jgi:hypothetical protein
MLVWSKKARRKEAQMAREQTEMAQRQQMQQQIHQQYMNHQQNGVEDGSPHNHHLLAIPPGGMVGAGVSPHPVIRGQPAYSPYGVVQIVPAPGAGGASISPHQQPLGVAPLGAAPPPPSYDALVGGRMVPVSPHPQPPPSVSSIGGSPSGASVAPLPTVPSYDALVRAGIATSPNNRVAVMALPVPPHLLTTTQSSIVEEKGDEDESTISVASPHYPSHLQPQSPQQPQQPPQLSQQQQQRSPPQPPRSLGAAYNPYIGDQGTVPATAVVSPSSAAHAAAGLPVFVPISASRHNTSNGNGMVPTYQPLIPPPPQYNAHESMGHPMSPNHHNNTDYAYMQVPGTIAAVDSSSSSSSSSSAAVAGNSNTGPNSNGYHDGYVSVEKVH